MTVMPDEVATKRPAQTRPTGQVNPELAKLAKVSIGTANRYLPKIRAAAVDSANADADEERALGPLNLTPFAAPEPPVLDGANGNHPTLTKERR